MTIKDDVAKFVGDPNITMFTTHKIAFGEPVMHVSHDVDGDWQFLPIDTPEASEASLIHLHHLLERDSSLAELHDLPLGWHAWRKDVKDPWTREAWSDEHINEFRNS